MEFPQIETVTRRNRNSAERVSAVIHSIVDHVHLDPKPVMSDHYRLPVIERPDAAQLPKTGGRWNDMGNYFTVDL